MYNIQRAHICCQKNNANLTMSGGNSSKHKASKRHSGWEEAGGEFYQELYPGGEGEIFENLQRADAAKLATLLPSKQARNSKFVRHFGILF